MIFTDAQKQKLLLFSKALSSSLKHYPWLKNHIIEGGIDSADIHSPLFLMSTMRKDFYGDDDYYWNVPDVIFTIDWPNLYLKRVKFGNIASDNTQMPDERPEISEQFDALLNPLWKKFDAIINGTAGGPRAREIRDALATEYDDNSDDFEDAVGSRTIGNFQFFNQEVAVYWEMDESQNIAVYFQNGQPEAGDEYHAGLSQVGCCSSGNQISLFGGACMPEDGLFKSNISLMNFEKLNPNSYPAMVEAICELIEKIAQRTVREVVKVLSAALNEIMKS